MMPYLKSLIATTSLLSELGITWGFVGEYSSHVADARELTLSGNPKNDVYEKRPLMGEVTYDKLMWIDSDIAWDPQDFVNLYNSDKEVISGAYLLANGEVTAYREPLKPGIPYDEVLKMEDPIKVHSVGFGFLCVKQGVFEQLNRPWFGSTPITYKNPETGDEYTFPLLGEDIAWCHKVGQLGIDIWLDPKVRVTHHKMMKLTWNGIAP
jgi:hypothetical protein